MNNNSSSDPNSLPQDTSSLEDKEKLALQKFWDKQFADARNSNETNNKEKRILLSPTGIKNIMQSISDKNVKNVKNVKIDSDAAEVLASVVEVFIQELTIRAWVQAEEKKKNTLDVCDVAMAIQNDQLLNHFLASVPYPLSDHDDNDEEEEEEENQEFPEADQMMKPPHFRSSI